LPSAQLDRAAFERDRGPVRQLLQKILRDPLDGLFRLPAAVVECLVEVTLAVEQGDGHHRQLAIGSCADHVAASIPRPPLYVGMAGCRAISIEK
jgi:hypothetical protein